MSDWHEAKVSRRWAAADGLFHLEVDLTGTPLPGTHQHAGQYVKLALPGVGEGFFAIASAPGQPERRFEFLIKGGSPLAEALRNAAVGATVQLSAPAGKGFPLSLARGKNLLLFATGSGISPIRSAIEALRRERAAYGRVTLYFGARTPDAFAYAADFDAWRKDGIAVVQTVSQPGESGWAGLTGYVQAHLAEVPVDDALAFLCGQKGMVQGVTSALEQRGLPKEKVFLNF